MPSHNLIATQEGIDGIRAHVARDGTLLLGPDSLTPGPCSAYRDGEVVWALDPPDETSWCVGFGGRFYLMDSVGLQRSNLELLDTQDGSPLWEEPYAGDFEFLLGTLSGIPGTDPFREPHPEPEPTTLLLTQSPGQLAAVDVADGSLRHVTNYEETLSNSLMVQGTRWSAGFLLRHPGTGTASYFSDEDPGLAWSIDEGSATAYLGAYLDQEILLLSTDTTLSAYRPATD